MRPAWQWPEADDLGVLMRSQEAKLNPLAGAPVGQDHSGLGDEERVAGTA
jgi:hypothetical protein